MLDPADTDGTNVEHSTKGQKDKKNEGEIFTKMSGLHTLNEMVTVTHASFLSWAFPNSSRVIHRCGSYEYLKTLFVCFFCEKKNIELN